MEPKDKNQKALQNFGALHELVHKDKKIILSILNEVLSKRSVICYQNRKAKTTRTKKPLGALIEQGIDVDLVVDLFEKQKDLPEGASELVEGILSSLCDGVQLPGDEFKKLCSVIECCVHQDGKIEPNNENIINLAQRCPEESLALLKIVGLNWSPEILKKLHSEEALLNGFLNDLYKDQNLETYKSGICSWRFKIDLGLAGDFYGLGIEPAVLKSLLDKILFDLKNEIYPTLTEEQRKRGTKRLLSSDYKDIFGENVGIDLYLLCEKPIEWLSGLFNQIDRRKKDFNSSECLSLYGTYVSKFLELKENNCLAVDSPICWEDWGFESEFFSNWQECFYKNFKEKVLVTLPVHGSGDLNLIDLDVLLKDIKTKELEEWKESLKVILRQLELNDEYFFKRSGVSKDILFSLGMLGALSNNDCFLDNKSMKNQIGIAFVENISAGCDFFEICDDLSVPAGILFNISMDLKFGSEKSKETLAGAKIMKKVIDCVWSDVSAAYKNKCSKVYETILLTGALTNKRVTLDKEKHLAVKEALGLIGSLYENSEKEFSSMLSPDVKGEKKAKGL